ncbi:hypothetical protein M0R72_02080 [Candidatus Pacearchaeota archaeon]|jgi:hypothetical protein|nr:hypothetical protein [Candidatus Pacearchaeota archaeon]
MVFDFKKILDHPEKTQIISKLVSGEHPKSVSAYLKDKYPKPDEGHLRIPATTLQEFLETYADSHGTVKKLIQRDADSKIDKRIADSLMDTRAWRDRVVEGVKKEINYLDKLDNVLTILETRSEQIFDMIQNDPENTRANDYVFTKYMELLMMAIEKCDKIRNDRPDVRIEHTYTVQMVEQQSVAFQNAIRRMLERLGPEYGSLFMDLLKEELSKMSVKDLPTQPITVKEIEKERKAMDNLSNRAEEFDQKFLEEHKDEETQESDLDFDPDEESDDF